MKTKARNRKSKGENTKVTAAEQIEMRPQPAQAKFLATEADIAIFGGAAGGGKSWALLFEALRHVNNPEFNSVIFRRTCPEITAPGGLWSESKKGYPYFGARARETDLSWTFPRFHGEPQPSGAIIKFGHLQYESDLGNWLGSQIAMIGFDQLETFTEQQFFYLMSRNRSTSGVRPYIRATANPEPGWLADFLEWWINQDTGFPIPERTGVLRWMIRLNDQILWADKPEDLGINDPNILPKSVTFIPAKLEDNPILMRADPGYLANLLALPYIDQQRLRYGNWKASGEKGEWPADYFPIAMKFSIYPTEFICSVLACDPSKGKESKFGDYCALVLLRVDSQWHLWVDAWLGRWSTTEILERVLEIYRQHQPTGVVFETNGFQEMLAGDFKRLCVERGIFPRVWGMYNTESKPTRIRRIGPFLAQHRLHLKAGSDGCKLLLDQLRAFGPKDPTLFDDGPDALELGIRMSDYLINGPAALGVGQPQAI